ncbi:ABC transporter ATP-binding protein [Phormidium sp. LEGE 05292]|uniref:ABC transporter ATP-binding protein n=1 Tax=[Phormidium] sp. LEGE 05292 TaxID=767427 RepID=UPI00188135D2|nr:ABC transporter ATP-binding protein [Phormidium sp. LEGE 05292]MBE9224531.1 ABC transporter ATP-binding protein [Phormidium sp. LEGE 05292]
MTETSFPILTARKLTLAYQGNSIVNELDLAIPSGKVTVLIGPNGCGKSTLLKGLARLLKPKVGTVYLNSVSLAKLPTKKIAKDLGILPQNPIPPEGLTVRELVVQGRYPHQTWLQQWSSEDEQITEQALLTTGMIELADRPLNTLSGGQRQRAWIAMALAQNTDILLLDEPTTFLDLAHQVELLDLLCELNQRRGRTIVMVLHDLNQACRYADYLVVIRNGEVYTHGIPEVVITETTIKEVFGLESQIISDPVTGTPLCIPLSRRFPQRSLRESRY